MSCRWMTRTRSKNAGAFLKRGNVIGMAVFSDYSKNMYVPEITD